MGENKEIEFLTYIIELCTVPEHQIDVIHKLFRWFIMPAVPLAEFGSDHRQVHGSLDDLIVMSSLHGNATLSHIFQLSSPATLPHFITFPLSICSVWLKMQLTLLMYHEDVFISMCQLLTIFLFFKPEPWEWACKQQLIKLIKVYKGNAPWSVWGCMIRSNAALKLS